MFTNDQQTSRERFGCSWSNWAKFGSCCVAGGMNSQETKKPDIVFDGELDFEKGKGSLKGSHNFLSLAHHLVVLPVEVP